MIGPWGEDSGDLVVDHCGRTLVLLPERAAYVPDGRLLLVADVHLGKADVFRAGGIAVPAQTAMDDLDRIDRICDRLDVVHIVFLGDLVHGRAGITAALRARWTAWRDGIGRVVTLVEGNHDRASGLNAWPGVEMVDEPFTVAGLALCHRPLSRSHAPVVAGHLHPAVRLAAGPDRVRLPCFALRQQLAVLPAFSSFAGGTDRLPGTGWRRYATLGDKVVEVPPRRARTRAR